MIFEFWRCFFAPILMVFETLKVWQLHVFDISVTVVLLSTIFMFCRSIRQMKGLVITHFTWSVNTLNFFSKLLAVTHDKIFFLACLDFVLIINEFGLYSRLICIRNDFFFKAVEIFSKKFVITGLRACINSVLRYHLHNGIPCAIIHCWGGGNQNGVFNFLCV